MNIIHICLLVGVWAVAIGHTVHFINLRDAYIKSNETEKPKELRKSQREFLCYLALALVYTAYRVL